MSLGPMVMVVRVNERGHLVGVYTDLPLDVVRVGPDGKAHVIGREGGLGSLVESVEQAVVRALDPYGHLTSLQMDTIATLARDTLTEEGSDQGFRRGTMESYVEKMSMQERLECISGDAECLREELGFDPDTGEDNDQEDEEPKMRQWGGARKGQHWHMLVDPQPSGLKENERVSACGAVFVLETKIKTLPLGKLPGLSKGSTCRMCRTVVIEQDGLQEE